MRRAVSVVAMVICGLIQSAHADEATRSQLAEQLLVAMHMPQNVSTSRDLVGKQLIPAFAAMEQDPKKREQLNRFLTDVLARLMTWDNLKEEYIKLYSEKFSEEELKALVEFFKSPVGKKYAEQTAYLTAASQEIGQRKFAEHRPKIIEELKAMKQESAPAADSDASKKTYTEGILQVTLPPTYHKVTENLVLDQMKKQFVPPEGGGVKQRFFSAFRKSLVDKAFIIFLGLSLPGPIDPDQMHNNMVRSFQRDLESGKCLKASRGISRTTIDNVSVVVADRETPRKSRLVHYYFVLPEDPGQMFSLIVCDDIDAFKANEAETAEIINSLKILRNSQPK